MKGRLAVVGAGLVAVLAIAAFVGGHRRHAELRISLVSSTEKADLMRTLVDRFNHDAHARVDGRTVQVDLRLIASGDAESEITSGSLRPVVWSPASSMWGRLLNFQAGANLVPQSNPSIVRTPLVVAMWEPMARALGWPDKPISFRKILDLATSPNGWAAYGHPEFGPFKLGHTDPDASTSGLSAVVAEYYAEAGQPRTLGKRELHNTRLQAAIKAIEQSVVRYGDTTLSFAQQLSRYGPQYASAVAMEETTLLTVKHSNPKLVAIYPSGGTFFSDSPFIVLNAKWVTPADRTAAHVLQRWLSTHVTPELAAHDGFRTRPGARLPAPLDRAHGVDPSEPTRELPFPSGAVLDSIRNDWRVHRKPANVELVVDASHEMAVGDRFASAKNALQAFIQVLAKKDQAGMISFSDQPAPHGSGVPAPLTDSQRGFLTGEVTGLPLGANSSLYDATNLGLARIQALRDPSRINALVVLDAGRDNRSLLTRQQLLGRLRAEVANPRLPVAIYSIAYGPDSDRPTMNALAEASHGYEFDATPSTIQTVLTTIASYF